MMAKNCAASVRRAGNQDHYSPDRLNGKSADERCLYIPLLSAVVEVDAFLISVLVCDLCLYQTFVLAKCSSAVELS